jgi:hypothetical protein
MFASARVQGLAAHLKNVKANALASSDIPIHAREVQVYDSVQDMVKGEQAAITFSSTLEVLAAYVATFNPEHEKWNGYLLFAKRALRSHQGGREIPESASPSVAEARSGAAPCSMGSRSIRPSSMRLCFQSLRATLIGSMPVRVHQACSSPTRCTAR